MLLYNYKIRLFSRKLKFHWSGPFTVVQASNFNDVELENEKGERFKVSGYRLKHYWSGEIDHASVSLPLSDPTRSSEESS